VDFCGGIMVALCGELERVVHGESPSTRLGLMCSWSSDGRWWAAGLRALAGPLRPLARASLAPYTEGRALAFLPDRFDVLKEQACLTPDTENCPELENAPYTVFAKSAAMTRLQIVLAQVLGNASVTLNLFDMVGAPTAEEPRYGRMLRELKPFLDGIATVGGPGGRPRGVSIPYDPRYADSARAPAEGGLDVFRYDGEGWTSALQGAGIPVFLNGNAEVYAMTGQSARALSPAAILERLSGGLLLDGSAAAVLAELGHSAHLGVKLGERLARHGILVSAERDDDAAGARPQDPCYLSARQIGADERTDHLYRCAAAPGARVISTLVDPDGHDVQPAFVLFENTLGGRVAVCPYDLSQGTGECFMNWRRRQQLQRVVRWLGRDRVPCFAGGGAWMAPYRRDYADYTFIAVLNFETDPWDDVTLLFDWGEPPCSVRFECLEADGRLREVVPAECTAAGPTVQARLDLAVPALGCVVLRLTART
jgi:hypothetical protein